ncbi:MAG: c-type cytochrome [Bacteroidota bacterium]
MKILKWIGIALVSLIIIVAAIFLFQIRNAENLIQRTVEIKPVQMTIPDDSVSLAIGEIWVRALCADCHNSDLGGKMFVDDPDLIGTIYTPNITKGQGGIAYYTDENWLSSLRHGVSPTGKPLMIMPSQEFTKMRAEDIGGIIAYMKTVPPVDRTNGQTEFKPFAKFLVSIGAFGDLFSYDVIDHQAPIPENITDETPYDRGKYLSLVTGCQSCHGEALSGQVTPDPNSPPSANLTPGGNLANWSYDDFTSFMHSGKTKEGKIIDTKFMPWQAYSHLPEEELEAIFTYLKSQDALETTQ